MVRLPEWCPWCGEKLVDFVGAISPDSEYRSGNHEQCLALYGVKERTWVFRCKTWRDRERVFPWGLPLPEAWRRRLSQYLGIPLRQIPTPDRCYSNYAVWGTGQTMTEKCDWLLATNWNVLWLPEAVKNSGRMAVDLAARRILGGSK